MTLKLTSKLAQPLLLSSAAGFGLSLLSALPAGAHGSADAGVIAGALHPLLGLDHLFLLLGVGLAASRFGLRLLGFSLAGAILGSACGSLGAHLPGAELLAALVICALGGALLLSQRLSRPFPLISAVLTAGVALHAMLHGQAASGAASWWVGALLASVLTTAGGFAAGRALNQKQWQVAAAGLCLLGGALALAPL